MTVAGTALALAVVTEARRTAATAADMAALAAAGERSGSAVAACALAGRMSTANRARLVTCRPDGAAVLVEVQVRLPAALSTFGPVTARSRAGPWLGTTGTTLEHGDATG